jgi:hypothetical protein
MSLYTAHMAHWPKQPHRQYPPQYYPSAPSSATTPSLFAGTTRSSISSAYSHASPGVSHYPSAPEPDVALNALLESAYSADVASPPTLDSGLLAGLDVDSLAMDIPIDMLGMDVDLAVSGQTYDAHAMDEFFGKMHELGIDTTNSADPRVRPADTLSAGPVPQSQLSQPPRERTPMLSGRKDKRKLNNYSLKDFRILHTLGTGSFGRVHLGRS